MLLQYQVFFIAHKSVLGPEVTNREPRTPPAPNKKSTSAILKPNPKTSNPSRNNPTPFTLSLYPQTCRCDRFMRWAGQEGWKILGRLPGFAKSSRLGHSGYRHQGFGLRLAVEGAFQIRCPLPASRGYDVGLGVILVVNTRGYKALSVIPRSPPPTKLRTHPHPTKRRRYPQKPVSLTRPMFSSRKQTFPQSRVEAARTRLHA